MLEDARTSYELQIASVPLTCEEKQSKLMAEYYSYKDSLEDSAGDVYEHAVNEEREKRKRGARCGVMMEEWSSTLRKQEAILEAIERKKGTLFGVERSLRETTIPDEVKRSTTSIPSTQPTPHNAMSSTWTDTRVPNEHLEMPKEAAVHEHQEEHKRQQEEFRKHADGPLLDEDTIKLLLFHDLQWSYITKYQSLQWSDFPWPVLIFAGPKNPDDLTLNAFSAYIMLEFDLWGLKQRLREYMKKWHPDRFEGRYLKKVPEGRERERVGLGAGIVMRFLTDLWRRFE